MKITGSNAGRVEKNEHGKRSETTNTDRIRKDGGKLERNTGMKLKTSV